MFLFTASVVWSLLVPRQNFLYRWLEVCLFQFILAMLIISIPGFGMGGLGKRMKEERSLIRCFLKNNITQRRCWNIQLILYHCVCTDLQVVRIQHRFTGQKHLKLQNSASSLNFANNACH